MIDKKKKKKKLQKQINKINKELIKTNNKLNSEYSTDNLINIVKFVKEQNNLYAGEIIENILIIIFSFAFKTGKENTFGKYLYRNIKLLKEGNNNDLVNWFKTNILHKEFSNLRKLFRDDFSMEEKENISQIQKKPIFIFLLEIYIEKYERKNINKEKMMNYLNRRIFDFNNKIMQKDNAKKDDQTKMDSYSTVSSYTIVSEYIYDKGLPIGKVKKPPIPLLRSLFISVYIYYQNKNSPSMEYIKEKDNLQKIPFVYELSEAGIETRFAGVVLSPVRIEPKIEVINVFKNRFRENGFLELAKIFLFNNKSIKKIDFHTCGLKSFYIDFLNMRLGLFDNYSVEVLNLSYNYLKEDCGEYLANILSHLKNLKTINLSSNDLKRGISSFIITLKNLYREGKTKLENLNLNECLLDDIAYYEIGELLKSKYCKLKVLCLNSNNIPSNINFLKKLKKNRSLVQIYFNQSNINNNDTDNVMRVISNTKIDYLYLYKNKINDFSQLLRIIYRTKLINKKEEENIKGSPYLYNLDLSNNDCYNKNIYKLKLLIKAIDETTLYCLDISHILKEEPDIFLEMNNNYYNNYDSEIKSFMEKLKNEQDGYIKNIEKINSFKVDEDRGNNVENRQLFENIDENEINRIINDNNANYPLFLRNEAKKLIINDNKIKGQIKNSNNRKEEYKKIHNELITYLKMKIAQNKIKELEKKIYQKKMIII